jgi:ribosomal protein S18 acetylase RimI-like enzyme
LPSIVTYHESHLDGVRLLWKEAFPNDAPWNAAEFAIPANLSMQPDVFLVAIDQDVVVGSAVSSIIAGYDGHRGWLYAVAVLKSHQRQGIATAMVREAEKLLAARWAASRSICRRDHRMRKSADFIDLSDTK